jgi:hypothetical protein
VANGEFIAVRALWKSTLEASQQEAQLAADLYNQSGHAGRRLEGFFVHMHLAWLYLFTAKYQKGHVPYFYRLPSGRYERVDGERKTWDLARFVREAWPSNDPVRRNLELTIALRNKIEHRFAEALAIATAGYAQSLLLNYEAELTGAFGAEYSLGSDLRFPVFVGVLSKDGAVRLAAAQLSVPKATKRFIAAFQADLTLAVREDLRYEFRIHLIPKMGTKTDADVAMTFVRSDELSDEQRMALADIGHTGTVVVRERIRDVANADKMKPTEASRRIQDRIPFKFSVHSHFPRAWKRLSARPSGKTDHPERTNADFCVYDRPHDDYLYTEAFVDKVAGLCSTEEGFETLVAMVPVRKPR